MASRKDENIYTFNSTHSVVKDFHEFSGIPIDIIELNIRNHRELTRDEWNHLNSTFKERDFYAQSKYYIYDLLSANYNWAVILQKLHSTNPDIFPAITNHPGKRFLEFGGGLGVFCEMVAHKGKDVTYVDIPGQVSDFASWRFKKYDAPIHTVCADARGFEVEGLYDIIYSDAVLEHVADPAAMVQKLCAHMAKKGLLILHIDLHGQTDDMPMHKNINIKHLHSLIDNLGFSNTTGKNKSFSMWIKK